MVANAMFAGVQRFGDKAELKSSLTYKGIPEYDVIVFYGLAGGLDRLFTDYRKTRKAVYVDLGYWGRRKRSRYDGYHKLAVNARHPTDYFQTRPHSADRFKQHGVPIRPWRETGRHILVAGMSAKAAHAEGLSPHSWERATIQRLRQLTDRPIIYRPKPNWIEAKPIPGSIFDKTTPLEAALHDCHAVVTHHSNVAVDALLAGVPCICPHGVASVLSGHRLEDIEALRKAVGRGQWAADLAWTQWSVDEMKSGAAWRYLRNEGLV